MTNEKALQIIQKWGLKKSAVSLACQIHPGIFGEWLNDKREIPLEQQIRISEYLNRFDSLSEQR
jgi:hypothetical protein